MTSAQPTPQRPPLQSLDEALPQLLAALAPLGLSESVPTQDSLGRVLAADVVSGLDVPPADNSAMDGYAVRVADLDGAEAVLPVSQRLPAGAVGVVLPPGTAARIFTGAQVPAGANAVAIQEQCEALPDLSGQSLGSVRIKGEVQAGQCIRRRGEDVQQGVVVLRAGMRMTAAAMGLAASVGAARLQVARPLRVALFSTGDELAMPGEALRPGAIYNSNRFTLRGLLQGLGCEVMDLGLVPDRLDATRAALREAAASADLILSSGGVSVGEEDHLRPAVQMEGELRQWQLAIKPGKPFAFGSVRRESGPAAWFMGLPGNPVASLVTFVLLVRPAILRLLGAPTQAPRAYALRADFDWLKADRRREFLRARLNDAGGLELFFNQGSGVLTSTVWGDGLVDVPPGQAIASGQLVRFLPFAELCA